jgi:hypothetical protein
VGLTQNEHHHGKKRTKTEPATERAPNEESTTINWLKADLTFIQHHQMPAPAFPLQLLPLTIETLVKGFAETQHLNPAYVDPSILGALSGSIGDRWRIAKPVSGEPLALLVGMVGRPGTGRSTTIEIAQGALQEAEATITADAKPCAHPPDAFGSRGDAPSAASRRSRGCSSTSTT